MIIDCISDLHGHYPRLEGGDLLIIAGDLTANDYPTQRREFEEWIGCQRYKKAIFIAGNHDNSYEFDSSFGHQINDYDTPIAYLCDSGTEFEYEELEDTKWGPKMISKKLKVWGSPWTTTFKGMNPKCKAFTVDTEKELYDKFVQIPDDIDILITHSPPFGICDGLPIEDGSLFHAGSKALYGWLKYVARPKLHIFGHIHEAYGQCEHFPTYNHKMMISVNASHVNERYKPVNKSVRIVL